MNKIEKDFSKVHLLIESLFQIEEDLAFQNSHLIHIRLSMVLSIVVHMKNSLIRYMDYESKETAAEKK